MWPRWLVPRFSIRTLLLVVAVVAVGLWFFYTLPVYLPDRQDRLARAAIDPYELSIAGNGDPAQAPPELVAILGDSRLKHWWRVRDIAFCGKTMLVSNGQDEVTRVWDTKSGKQLRSLSAKVAATSGDGSTWFRASPNQGDLIEVWRTTEWKRERAIDLRRGQPVRGIVASRNGSRFAAVFGDRDEDCEVHVWDVAGERMIHQFQREKGNVPICALDESGQRLAIGGKDLLRIVNVDSGSVLGQAGPFQTADGHSAYVYRVLFDSVPDRIIIEDAVGVATWNYSSGKKVHTLPLPQGSPSGIALYPHGSGWLTVASGGSAWRFVRDGDGWRTFGSVSPDAARQVGISALADWGDILALGGGHSLVLAGREGGAVVLADGEKPNVQRLAFDSLRRFVATSASDGKVSLWKFGTWHHMRTWSAESRPLWHLAFTPDGTYLISMGSRGLVIWDPVTGTQQRIIETGVMRREFAISSDSQLVASSQMLLGAPYSIRVWNIADGSVHKTISHPSAKIRGQLAFAGSNDTLVMGGGKGMTVWDLANSKLLADLGTKTIHDVPLAVHPDGKRVAMQPWYGPIDVWDITTQKNVLSVRVHAGKSLVNSIAIHPSGKWAASAGEDGTACLWEFDTGAVLKSWQLGPPKGIVFQVAFSPDGRYLATVNGNGTAYILRIDRIVGKSASAGAISEGK